MMERQPLLFEQDAYGNPTVGHRDGATYEKDFDYDRLNRQSQLVYAIMQDHDWHTLPEIAAKTGQPEASISARLRDFRKEKFGGHVVEKRRVDDGGLHEYRLVK